MLPSRKTRVDAFWLALSEVLHARGSENTTCLSLSGGLDSGALVPAMVSTHGRLDAFAVVAPNLDASAEEPGLCEVEREFPQLRLTRIDASEVVEYPTMQAFELRDDPPLVPMALLAARTHLWSLAAARGFRTVVEGEGGDELFSTLLSPLDALLGGDWRTLIRQLRVRRGRRSLLQWGIALPMAPRIVRSRLARRWSRERARLPPFMAPRARAMGQIRVATDQFVTGLVHVPFRTRTEAWLESPMTVAAAHCRTDLASKFGLSLIWPLLDRRVIELTLGLPSSDLLSQRGEDKSFLRLALRNRAPEAVVTRAKDIRLYHVLVSRMLGSLDSFRVVRDGNVRKRLSDWIDFDMLEAMLHAAGARKIGSLSLLWQLECVVSFADWYARASREWGIQ
ncbi:MAG TPA: asparagine synthase C-terminal domain-containing protein [Polyangiaceae bacterium]|nr:asparagine synthase C-terminal domain-containing protein [Polyangiaceae bacterium]